MLNFPLPYPDELLYSTIARAGVRMGITSPKELLDEVFGDRKVVATPDLPGHLQAIAMHYPGQAGLTIEALAYRHTLFPLYAPFVPEKRRRQCLRMLARHTRGTVHLRLGVAASRVKQPRVLRACPACVDEQIRRYGEPYWMRGCQVQGTKACPRHGRLAETSIPRHAPRRHSFAPLAPSMIVSSGQMAVEQEDVLVAKRIWELLDLPPRSSPTLDQWSQFYAALAADRQCTAGRRIIHSMILDRILLLWPSSWLERLGLAVVDSSSCWLQGVFRRHRKAISYLEHIIVLEAFLDPHWGFQEVIQKVANLPRMRPVATAEATRQEHVAQDILEKRHIWQTFLKRYGVRAGRRLGGGAVYAALYRRDRVWLLSENKRYRIEARRKEARVDWAHRDQAIFARLHEEARSRSTDLSCPRRSRRWYLLQAGPATTIVRHLGKLPMTAGFLEEFSESVDQYQVRRIRAALEVLAESGLPPKRWRILRAAGLSEIRLKASARNFLNKVD